MVRASQTVHGKVKLVQKVLKCFGTFFTSNMFSMKKGGAWYCPWKFESPPAHASHPDSARAQLNAWESCKSNQKDEHLRRSGPSTYLLINNPSKEP